MYVLLGCFLIVVGALLGTKRSDDWSYMISIWLVVVGTLCMVSG